MAVAGRCAATFESGRGTGRRQVFGGEAFFGKPHERKFGPVGLSKSASLTEGRMDGPDRSDQPKPLKAMGRKEGHVSRETVNGTMPGKASKTLRTARKVKEASGKGQANRP